MPATPTLAFSSKVFSEANRWETALDMLRCTKLTKRLKSLKEKSLKSPFKLQQLKDCTGNAQSHCKDMAIGKASAPSHQTRVGTIDSGGQFKGGTNNPVMKAVFLQQNDIWR